MLLLTLRLSIIIIVMQFEAVMVMVLIPLIQSLLPGSSSPFDVPFDLENLDTYISITFS